MSNDTLNNPMTELTTTATGAVHYARVTGPQLPLPIRALFDVEVDGLFSFSLIPKCDLAKDLMLAWLGGETRKVWEGITSYPTTTGKRLTFHIEHSPLLSSGPDVMGTAQSITPEEHAVALAAIEAHRESKRPKKRSRR